MNLNQTDLNVRLQLSGQKYSELLSKYEDYLRFGKSDNSLKLKLLLLDNYIKLLLKYDISKTTNCINEVQAQLICDKISKLTGLCFKPIGYTYQP